MSYRSARPQKSSVASSTTVSGPSDRAWSALRALQTAVMRSPIAWAICTAHVPTPPDAPLVSTPMDVQRGGQRYFELCGPLLSLSLLRGTRPAQAM